MDDAHRQPGAGGADDAAPELSIDAAALPPEDPSLEDLSADDESEAYDESLLDEIGALIDDGRTYIEAEVAFQRTRAKLAWRLAGVSAGLVVVAIILLHIALLALAVGLVIALQPHVTIWGAVAIVVGGMLACAGALCWMAWKRASKLEHLFSHGDRE